MEPTNEPSSSKSTDTGDHAPAVTPTITLYQKLASAMIASVSEAAAAVPGYGDDLGISGRGVRKPVPPSVITMVVAAVESSPELIGVDQFDVMDARDTLQFSQAFRPAVDHLLGVARRLTLMMDVREAKAGRNALNTYGIARRVVRNPNTTHLMVHVENIRAELRRRRIGRILKAKQQDPETPAGNAD